MPQLTKHAISRMKERCGISKTNASKIARRAYAKGITHSQTTGNIHKFLDSIYLSQKKGTDMRIYGDAVYVFNKRNDILITVIKVPADLMDELRAIKQSIN